MMGQRPIDRLRAICLALPESYEEVTWSDATFRVRKKIFASASDHGTKTTVALKTSREEQVALLASGGPFYRPAYVGSKGWIGIDLTSPDVDWSDVSELVRESFRLIAPKGLSSTLP